MLGETLIFALAIVAAVVSACFLLVAFVIMLRRSRSGFRREAQLSLAFDRARDMRVHGSIPVGSRYGIFEEKVRRAGALR